MDRAENIDMMIKNIRFLKETCIKLSEQKDSDAEEYRDLSDQFIELEAFVEYLAENNKEDVAMDKAIHHLAEIKRSADNDIISDLNEEVEPKLEKFD